MSLEMEIRISRIVHFGRFSELFCLIPALNSTTLVSFVLRDNIYFYPDMLIGPKLGKRYAFWVGSYPDSHLPCFPYGLFGHRY